MPDALVFAAIAQRLRGVPVLLDLHELMPELYASKFGVSMDHPLPRFLAGVERWAVRFADACLAVSEPCLERYVDRGSDPDKFTVVMNTADPGLFTRPVGASSPVQHGSAAVGDSRRSLRGGPAMGRIVSHGTLVHRYGFDIIIEALSKLPGVELDIVGDGEERSALQRLARRLGVADRVNFSGRIALSEVPALLSQADIGVVANRSDQFTDLVVPTKLMEYVALGVPAVVARTPAVEAYFDDRAVAFFTPGDVEDLRRRMAELLACPQCRRDIVAHADATFGARYAGSASADAYIGVVERLGSARGDLSRTQG
jgi:glycosyltransferase involved in cell wall biosynthesis